MAAYDTVLFDLDGTLIKTPDSFICKIIGNTLDQFDVEKSEDLARRLWFDDRRRKILQEELHIDPKSFWDYFYDHSHTIQESERVVSLYTPKDREVVSFLKDKHIKTGIVSANRMDYIDMEVSMFHKHLFDCIISTNGSHHSKVEGLQEAMQLLGSTPQRTLYVGNSDGDIANSQKVGIDCAIIDRKEYPVSLQPKYPFENLAELVYLFGTKI